MPIHPGPRKNRRGMVLLVVLAVLTLFAVAGLTFVLYAEAASESARISRDAESLPASADAPPGQLLDYFLDQLLCDAPDDADGVYSALRGHGLLRGEFGLNYDYGPGGVIALGNNSVPYNGTGRLHGPTPFAADATATPQALDEYNLVNYTYFPADGFLRDPERPGSRADPSAPRRPFWGGFNAPYTYPDLNTLALAAVKADGTVLLPSYHRPWAGFGPLDPSNPNWADADKPWLKYLVLRPRPADNPPMNGRPGFPPPADPGGDVKNLADAPGGNDSIWLDLNYPILTAPDGRRFRPLFAPLVVDLDGRANVNVHGNMAGAAGAHVSNQGWGPWEVGLDRVLKADAAEWQNLLRGVRDPQSLPGSAAFGPTPHFYAGVDFDARRPDGSPTPPLLLPAPSGGFPAFPAGYDDADAAERAHHPALAPAARFNLADLDALRRLGLGAAGGSLLSALCPLNFADARTRRLVTTRSSDPDAPGVGPWAAGGVPYAQVIRDPLHPKKSSEKLAGGGAKPFPAPGAAGEFTADGRADDAAPGRVDVNRPLPDYPAPGPDGHITDKQGFLAAQRARQELARDVYVRVVRAVGAYDPDSYQTSAPPTTPQRDTLRWLAQFAVNIVDFIDADDYSTPFNWGRVGAPAFAAQYGGQWVFGAELPRVAVNEAYAEYLNLPGQTGIDDAAAAYQVNVWAELYNPFRSDPTLSDGGAARLDGAYQLVLTRPNHHLLGAGDDDNPLGDPDNTGPAQAYDPAQVYGAVSAFAPAALPVGGYSVVGPPAPAPGVGAWEPGAALPAARVGGMTYQTAVAPGQTAPPPAPTLLLRRLACPALPYQPDPALGLFNPYVTVDYLENVPINAGNSTTGAGYLGDPPPPDARTSVGRRQPYDGNPLHTPRQAPSVAQPGQPRQTFGGPNHDANSPAPPPDWLVHPDRPLVSPMELLHVPCCKPHQLTHLFKNAGGDPYQSFGHAPYWLLRDPSSPLYRAFAFLQTHSRVAGVDWGDPVPGRINLNTVWDPEVFDALCDAAGSNYFNESDVQQIYAWMTAGRTPAGAPGPGDRPFKDLGAPAFSPAPGAVYADGDGLNDTILRDNPAHPLYDAAKRPIRLFEIAKSLNAGVVQDHPYQRYELLTKIYNQTTTRSNVFAVWLTVGFFEVNDDAVRPAKLGAELIGRNGAPVRHHLFAVVDRSTPPAVLPGPGEPAVTAPTPVAAAGQAVVTPTVMAGGGRGYTWAIRPGMVLRVTGPDATGAPASENVVVVAATNDAFTALFRRAYPQGFTSIVGYGNPGPGAYRFAPGYGRTLASFVEIVD